MDEETIRDIAELDLPYRRRARVREVTFASGMRMVRLILQEGKRITQVDLDDETARALSEILASAAKGPLGDSVQ